MRTLHYGAVAALGLVVALGPALGQEKKVAPPKGQTKPAPQQLILTVGSTRPVQMAKKQPIQTVINENPDVIRVSPKVDDLTTVLLTALMPGRARLTLIGADGKKEVHQFGKPSEKVALAQR